MLFFCCFSRCSIFCLRQRLVTLSLTHLLRSTYAATQLSTSAVAAVADDRRRRPSSSPSPSPSPSVRPRLVPQLRSSYAATQPPAPPSPSSSPPWSPSPPPTPKPKPKPKRASLASTSHAATQPQSHAATQLRSHAAHVSGSTRLGRRLGRRRRFDDRRRSRRAGAWPRGDARGQGRDELALRLTLSHSRARSMDCGTLTSRRVAWRGVGCM